MFATAFFRDGWVQGFKVCAWALGPSTLRMFVVWGAPVTAEPSWHLRDFIRGVKVWEGLGGGGGGGGGSGGGRVLMSFGVVAV